MKRVAIIPNIKKDVSLSLTQQIVQILSLSGAQVFLPIELNDSCIDAQYLPRAQIFDEVDFVVTVGGDGTILGIAEEVSERDLCVIGINLGRMGFMAELEPVEINLLTKVIADDFKTEKRMMLEVSILRNGKRLSYHRALNDIVVGKGSISKISELELYCNGTFVSHFNTDGLIVATPTGSTAYSLSAGGSIIDPEMDCMLLTPVCPHSFNNSRSVVFSPKSVLEIKDVQDGEENTYLTVDGRINEQLAFTDIVEIRTASKAVTLIKLKDEPFYNRVYQKIAERK